MSLTEIELGHIAELARQRMDDGVGHHGEQWRLGGRTAINFMMDKLRRRIATGQQEDALVLRALVAAGHVEQSQVDHGRDILRQLATPKPAGAVPLPETVAYRWNFHGVRLEAAPCNVAKLARDEGLVVDDLCTVAEAITYGDAREAAGHADAVPDGWRDTVRKAADDIAYAAYNAFGRKLDELDPSITDSTAPAEVALIAERALREMLAAPLPQQPPAEGAGRDAVARDVELAELLADEIEPYATNGGQYVVDGDSVPVIVDALRCYAHPSPVADAEAVVDALIAAVVSAESFAATQCPGDDNTEVEAALETQRVAMIRRLTGADHA